MYVVLMLVVMKLEMFLLHKIIIGKQQRQHRQHYLVFFIMGNTFEYLVCLFRMILKQYLLFQGFSNIEDTAQNV